MPKTVRTLWPGNQVPISILLDDPTPCRNPMWYEFPDDGHEAVVPLAFAARFADMCERTGAAGKFSLVPCPGAEGRVDQALPGIAADDLERFLSLVRERIAPRWSIGPEMLTHGNAIDLETGQVLPMREDVWAARQDERTLTRYIAHALRILVDAGFEPTGVTSPWSFGVELEDAYTGAITTALREVCDTRVGWYFLHSDTISPTVAPRPTRIDPQRASALISIVSGQRDWLWETQYGEPAYIDTALSRDGISGRLAELFGAGGPIVFTTHWQSLFSNGSGAGLDQLTLLCERINRVWGDRVRWTPVLKLAQYSAACASLRVEPGNTDHGLRITTRVTCPDFTCALDMPPDATTLRWNGLNLERCPDGQIVLVEGCWSRFGNEAHVCFPLQEENAVSWPR